MTRTHITPRRWLALLSGFSLIAAGAGLGGGSAFAEEPRTDDDIIEKSAWGTFTWSAPVEGYAEIPLPIITGYPMTESQLFTPHPACETRSAAVWMSYALEEGLIPGNVPGADTDPENPKSTYVNPTLARAANPPYEGTYGSAPVKAETAPHGTSEAGPLMKAECKSPLHALGSARVNGLTVGDIKVGQSVATTTQHFEPQKLAIVSESTNSLVDVDLGALRIREVGVLLDVDLPQNEEPVVSYRYHLKGVSDAEGRPVWLGEQGLALAGQNVPMGELVQQFNEQLAANQEAVEALGHYGISIMAPRAYQDGFDRYNVESPTVDLGYGFAARQKGTGQFQALRLGMARFVGVFYSTDRALGS